ncbi:MAG TPA: zinc ribbon domain-containing protein [Candidatus Eisenbacteria bacterium]|jgi:hypothetical protein|nr:zinc ribbon domain-containing protein [Candidatus Eisenbacteria bacterium]
MEYTEDQKRRFREEFASKRQTRVLATVLVLLCACLLVVLTPEFPPRGTDVLLVLIFGILLLMGVVYLVHTSRCPACGRLVGRPMRARFCDQCGIPLR